LPVNLPWTAFGKAWRSREKLLTEIEQLIQERQTLLQTNPDRPETDALDIMLNARDEETGEGLSTAELKDQVLLLLFAGHETLTSAIASFCLLMAQNPDVMTKARKEQSTYAEQPLTLDLLKEMTYLDQVIKEVLRAVPPVGGGFRKVLRDCEYGGFTIPKGWSALYQINSTHSDNSVFPNPKDFDPERFSLSAQKLKPFSHIPFGGGLRECIGKEFARLEMKVFAARLLREYQWTLLPNQDLSMQTVPTPKPRDGLKVHFEQFSN
ncbi:MAG: cytochrome P450, partial [Cyanobacteria bacterium J06576_12]